MAVPLLVGDRVALSRDWIRLTCQVAGPLPFARGVIKELVDLGSITLAVVDWGGDPEIPTRINVGNLARVSEHGLVDEPV